MNDSVASTPRRPLVVDAIVPALDEEGAIGAVVTALSAHVRRVVVCDNGSRDATADCARAAGALVVTERARGYGAACLRAMEALRSDPPDVVVFADGDGSDAGAEVPVLLEPIEHGRAEFVVGSRTRGHRERGALTVPQRVGNSIATRALGFLYGVRATDLGPFRAIRWGTLESLGMRDRDFGWTVEMQIRAARMGVRTEEVAVSCLRRAAGTSKVSGTVRGSMRAGAKILALLVRAGLGREPP